MVKNAENCWEFLTAESHEDMLRKKRRKMQRKKTLMERKEENSNHNILYLFLIGMYSIILPLHFSTTFFMLNACLHLSNCQHLKESFVMHFTDDRAGLTLGSFKR